MCDTLQKDVRASDDGKTACLQAEHIFGWTSKKLNSPVVCRLTHQLPLYLGPQQCHTAVGPDTVEAPLIQHPTISANTSEANNKGTAGHKGYDRLR